MERPDTSTMDWNEYYRVARRRRHAMGGDLVRRFIKRRKVLRRNLVVAWGLAMATLALAFVAISGP